MRPSELRYGNRYISPLGRLIEYVKPKNKCAQFSYFFVYVDGKEGDGFTLSEDNLYTLSKIKPAPVV